MNPVPRNCQGADFDTWLWPYSRDGDAFGCSVGGAKVMPMAMFIAHLWQVWFGQSLATDMFVCGWL